MQKLEQVAALLPEIVREIVDIIGFADTEKLIRAFGGLEFFFRKGEVYYPKLIDVLGEDVAEQLYQYFKGERVYLPRCDIALRALRNARFRTEYHYLTQNEQKSGRQAMIALCPKYQISDRMGWEIVRQSHRPGPPHLSQGDLFLLK